MSISIHCPECGAVVNAPDSAAGSTVWCQKCRSTVPVPARAARPVSARPIAARPSRNEDEDDRPRRRSAARDDDEDDDDRPRRKAKKGGVPVWVFAVGGAVLLLVIVVAGVVGYFVLNRGSDGGGGGGFVGGGGLIRKAPPGWTDVRDGEGGYQVFLPGQIHKSKHTVSGPRAAAGVQVSAHGGSDGSATVMARSVKQPANFTPGTTPDLLFAHLKQEQPGFDAPWNDIESKTPVTLGGKPGLMVKVKEKKDWMNRERGGVNLDEPPDPRLPEDFRKQVEESRKKAKQLREKNEAANAAQPGWREVFFVTVNGPRVIVIQWRGKGEYLDEAALKTIVDSFEFL